VATTKAFELGQLGSKLTIHSENITLDGNVHGQYAGFDSDFTASIASINSGSLSEGTNLYYTDARADARIAAADTGDLSEGSNLYYTDARADARVSLIVDAAPGTLNTLNELAAALGDDANFSTTVTNSIATKLPLAGGTLTGGLTVQASTGQLRLQGTSNTNKNVSIFYNESGDYGQINVDESGVNQKDLWVTGLNLKFGRSTSSESMRITSSGNVGIGTDSPSVLLHAVSPSTAIARFQGSNEGNLYITNDDDYVMTLQTSTSTSMAFNTAGGNERMRIDASGNVGIGTDTPEQQLDVRGSIGLRLNNGLMFFTDANTNGATNVNGGFIGMAHNAGYHVTSNDGGFASNANSLLIGNYHSSGGDIILATTNAGPYASGRVIIKENGNVGIGTSSPGEKLSVNGSVQVLGNNDANYSAKFISGYDSTHGLRITTRINSSTESEVLGVFANSGGGSPRLALNPSNGWNVGIGDTNPLYKLSVNNGTSDGGIFRLYNEEVGLNVAIDGTTGSPNYTNASRTVVFNATRMDSGTAPKLRLGGQGGVEIAADANNVRMVVGSNGDVGIGVTSPSEKLHVKDGNFRIDTDTNSTLNIKDAGTNAIAIYAASSDELYVGSNDTYKLRFKTDGNIVMDNGGYFGIGTASPSTHLNVKGAVNYHGIIEAESTSGDAYTQNNFNNAPIITVISPNAVDNYSGIRYTNSAGNYEWYAGTHQYASQEADYVFQGYHRSGGGYKEKMRIREDGSIRRKFSYHTSWNGSSVLVANLIGINGFSSSNCRGEISIMGAENNLNMSFAKYIFVVSYYSPSGTFYVNLTQTGRARVNNSFGDAFVHLTNQQYNSTNQTYSTGSNAAANIYARTGGSYGSMKIMIDFYDHN